MQAGAVRGRELRSTEAADVDTADVRRRDSARRRLALWKNHVVRVQIPHGLNESPLGPPWLLAAFEIKFFRNRYLSVSNSGCISTLEAAFSHSGRNCLLRRLVTISTVGGSASDALLPMFIAATVKMI